MDLTQEKWHEAIKLIKEMKDDLTLMKNSFKNLVSLLRTAVLEEKVSEQVIMNCGTQECEVMIHFSEDFSLGNTTKVTRSTSNKTFIEAKEWELPDTLLPKARLIRKKLYATAKEEFDLLNEHFFNVLGKHMIFDPGGK